MTTNLQKVLAVAIGMVLLMGAGCGSRSNGTIGLDQPNNNSVSNSDNTTVAKHRTIPISYGNGEFTPKSITINVGDTIIFENMGDDATTTFKGDVATYVPGGTGADVWPAADPCPAHTSVPGFDAKQRIKVGGTYSFTFTSPQTVSYHNHLNPAQTGTIIVK
ncbi:MAG: hypothetical protein WC400_03205 [Patescibacteria group bacterium]|jgi:plastocyanin